MHSSAACSGCHLVVLSGRKETLGEIQSKICADSHVSFNHFDRTKRRILVMANTKNI